MTETLMPASEIRTEFSRSKSELYAEEVPLYSKEVEVVRESNERFLAEHPEQAGKLGSLERITEERHGAIRVGTPEEYQMIARLFAVMGMRPVGFYDLTTAPKPQPVIATAFRPVDEDELAKNPFRMFTSLLLPEDEKFFSAGITQSMETQLAKRNIFSDRLIELIELHEKNGGLTRDEGKEFVEEARQTFKFINDGVPGDLYDRLLRINGVAADSACFQRPHLNHLTPRAIDIDDAQRQMEEMVEKPEFQPNRGMKKEIEGPPRRNAPILLRQTSYNALPEEITRVEPDGSTMEGIHTARFGEIEQRGVALTVKGRALYDEALKNYEEWKASIGRKPGDATAKEHQSFFAGIPDSYEELRVQKLAYFRYKATEKGETEPEMTVKDLDTLVEEGHLTIEPIVYEDFLPASAAGIFGSNQAVETNAKDTGGKMLETRYTKEDLEEVIKAPILDYYAIYAAQQAQSIQSAYEELNLTMPKALEEETSRAIKNDPRKESKGNGRST